MRTCLFYLFLLVTSPLVGQECPTGQSITLSTQEAVDSFPIKYPDCRDIAGDLIIEGNERDSITDLRGLSGLRSVSGQLSIRSTYLTDLSDLRNLEAVNGKLSIWNNFILTSLAGIQDLKTGTRFVTISNNPELENLDGFPTQLKGVHVDIVNNERLENLQGMSGLDTLSGLTLQQNPNVCSLGFSPPITVTSGILFTNLPRLKSLHSLKTARHLDAIGLIALDSLQSLQGLEHADSVYQVVIDNCHSLTTLNGLQGLRSVSYLYVGGFRMDINQEPLNKEGNRTLKSLDGLENLHRAGFCLVSYNNSLTSIDALRNLESDYLNISNNNGLRVIRELPAGGDDMLLHIYQNAALDSILSSEAPKQLHTLYLYQNPALSSISGFNNLKYIEHDAYISNNNQLDLKDGFKQLETIGRDLEIIGNNQLTNLEAFRNLQVIRGQLLLSKNPQLNLNSGFKQLETIGGNLVISDNNQLANLEAFRNLQVIRGQLQVSRNIHLSSIEGLRMVDPGQLNDLNISHNPVMDTCTIPLVCEMIDQQNPIYQFIYRNGPRCSFRKEIKEDCNQVTTSLSDPIESPIHILPNPATELLQLSIQQPGRLRIFSASGQLQVDQAYQADQPVSIARLPAGMYVARLSTTQGRSYAGRFVKQ